MKNLTSVTFRKMIQEAMLKVQHNKDYINSLNVFPVPDGDTGSNMTMTLKSGNKYVSKNTSDSVGKLLQSFAQGLLMGARGNSGVILSQIFRGFMKPLQNKKVLSASDVITALKNSTSIAYKSVMKPQEGTILTVIRLGTKSAVNEAKNTNNLKDIFNALYVGSNKALQKTPDMMALLKKVGVVDSGGQGLVYVFQAFDEVINGKKVESFNKLTPEEMTKRVHLAHHNQAQSKLNPAKIKYTYCTQMTVRFGLGKECNQKFNYQKFYDYLAKLGNSLLVANDNHVVKVHVHTEHPGKVLAWGQKFGDLTKVKVDNMHYQQETIIKNDRKKHQNNKPKKLLNTGVLSIISGNGLKKMFKSLGVTSFVNGGQTMNPNTQDILDGIKKCPAHNVVVLPNNSNIFMASKEASKLSPKPVSIIRCKTINQGLASMLGYNSKGTLKQNAESMSDNLDEVKSCYITYATRNTDINGDKIKKGWYLGFSDKKFVDANPNLTETAIDTVNKSLDDMSSVVTIIYGKDSSNHTKAIAQSIAKRLKKNPDLDVEVHYGGQPVYPLLISVE